MMRCAAIVGFVVAAVSLAACAAAPGTGDTVLNAIGQGAMAGLVEGLTGQEQPNPYLSGNAQPQQQQSAPAADPRFLEARYGKRQGDMVAQGHIDVGMNEEEVQLAWGAPIARNPKGKSSEIWNYGEDKVVFTRGKVSAVTH